MALDKDFSDRILRDFALLMRDHLGGGYVAEFYVNEAGPMAAACEHFVEEALAEERERTRSAQIHGYLAGWAKRSEYPTEPSMEMRDRLATTYATVYGRSVPEAAQEIAQWAQEAARRDESLRTYLRHATEVVDALEALVEDAIILRTDVGEMVEILKQMEK